MAVSVTLDSSGENLLPKEGNIRTVQGVMHCCNLGCPGWWFRVKTNWDLHGPNVDEVVRIGQGMEH